MALYSHHSSKETLHAGDMRTEIILGPPGTGKTHELIKHVRSAIDRGIEPEKIAFLTFTRQAAAEAVMRVCDEFSMPKSRFPYFRTLHSLAYWQLGLKPSEVITKKHYKTLEELLGLEFTGNSDQSEGLLITGTLGDKLLGLYNLSRARNRSMETEWESGRFYDFPKHAALQFEKDFKEFKAYHGVLDFPDFLDMCHQPLDVKLFIIDEAQDLTPQQWSLARRLASYAEKVIIAGDDDQAIYEWSGADASMLSRFSAEKKVLPVSHRLTKEIYSVATSISSRIQDRIEKQWSPSERSGLVERGSESLEEHIDLSSGEWLLLCRHRYQIPRLERMVRQAGRTYVKDHKSILRSPSIRAVIAYEKLRKGNELSIFDLQNIAKFTSYFDPPTIAEQTFKMQDLPVLSQDKDWMEALDLISYEDKEYLRSLKRRGESLIAEPKVRITTIHGSKGAEADNVYLMSHANTRVRREAQVNMDAELRVWYVGVSRARQNLFIGGPELFV